MGILFVKMISPYYLCMTKITKMKNLQELKVALQNNTPLVWNDPNPIDGNDYTITFVEDLSQIIDDEYYRNFPILIQYGGGSEAQVFLHEIFYK